MKPIQSPAVGHRAGWSTKVGVVKTLAIVSLLLALTDPLCSQASAAALGPPDAFEVSASSDLATGNVQLTWRPPEGVDASTPRSDEPIAASSRVHYEVEETRGDDVVTINAGHYQRAALSGREDGTYAYRVRAIDVDGRPGAWSHAIEAHVAHHPLWLALLLFSTGAFVFLATAGLIVIGHMRTRSSGAPTPQAPAEATTR